MMNHVEHIFCLFYRKLVAGLVISESQQLGHCLFNAAPCWKHKNYL